MDKNLASNFILTSWLWIDFRHFERWACNRGHKVVDGLRKLLKPQLRNITISWINPGFVNSTYDLALPEVSRLLTLSKMKGLWSVKIIMGYASTKWRKCLMLWYDASNSQPKVLYLLSGKVFEKKGSGWVLSIGPCSSVAPTATAEASTMSDHCSFGFG